MSFRDIELKPEYRSRLDNVIRDFYNPVLKQAVTYKRAVGFFSSSALLSLTAGICGLVENGGSIQMPRPDYCPKILRLSTTGFAAGMK